MQKKTYKGLCRVQGSVSDKLQIYFMEKAHISRG